MGVRNPNTKSIFTDIVSSDISWCQINLFEGCPFSKSGLPPLQRTKQEKSLHWLITFVWATNTFVWVTNTFVLELCRSWWISVTSDQVLWRVGFLKTYSPNHYIFCQIKFYEGFVFSKYGFKRCAKNPNSKSIAIQPIALPSLHQSPTWNYIKRSFVWQTKVCYIVM